MEHLLVEQLKQGNEDAFRYIYEHHYALLCRFANRMLGDMAIAEEIVDDAIFYLWEHRTEVEITHSVRAYLMRAVRNHCLNELNSLRHRTEMVSSSFSFPKTSTSWIKYLWKRVTLWAICWSRNWKANCEGG